MNYYIFKDKDENSEDDGDYYNYSTKFHCLNHINQDYTYRWSNTEDLELQCLYCYEYDSINLIHRIGGPAIEWPNGDCHYIVMGKLHREDGPAIDLDGLKKWYYNDEQIHCKDNDEFLKIISMKAFL